MRRTQTLPSGPILLAWISTACAAAPPPSEPDRRPARQPQLLALSSASLPTASAAASTEPEEKDGEPRGLMPAGLCGFENYLHEACGDDSAPAYAVVLTGPGAVPAEIEAVARKQSGIAGPGYPFAVSFDDMPSAKNERKGLGLIGKPSGELAYCSG